MGTRADVETRFWAQVDQSGGADSCWPWLGARFKSTGYGQFRYQGRPQTTHRVARILIGDPPPEPRLDACHTCDIRECCNPRHSFWGTRKANVEDMISKGRHSHGPGHGAATSPERKSSGERNGRHKLTVAQVLAIRAAVGPSNRQLGRDYGVNHHIIAGIKAGTRWAHIGA